MVSAGADQQILIWSMLTQTVCKKLLGHCDVIYRLFLRLNYQCNLLDHFSYFLRSVSISPDCSVLVSGSHDQTIRTWYTTPRHPDAPEPPRMIAVTDTTVLLTWKAPPSFSLEITAFHLQYRIGRREKWYPVEGLSIPPHFRSKVVKNLMAATHYQFRIRAENKMGLSGWSGPSKLVRISAWMQFS